MTCSKTYHPSCVRSSCKHWSSIQQCASCPILYHSFSEGVKVRVEALPLQIAWRAPWPSQSHGTGSDECPLLKGCSMLQPLRVATTCQNRRLLHVQKMNEPKHSTDTGRVNIMDADGCCSWNRRDASSADRCKWFAASIGEKRARTTLSQRPTRNITSIAQSWKEATIAGIVGHAFLSASILDVFFLVFHWGSTYLLKVVAHCHQ